MGWRSKFFTIGANLTANLLETGGAHAGGSRRGRVLSFLYLHVAAALRDIRKKGFLAATLRLIDGSILGYS